MILFRAVALAQYFCQDDRFPQQTAAEGLVAHSSLREIGRAIGLAAGPEICCGLVCSKWAQKTIEQLLYKYTVDESNMWAFFNSPQSFLFFRLFSSSVYVVERMKVRHLYPFSINALGPFFFGLWSLRPHC